MLIGWLIYITWENWSNIMYVEWFHIAWFQSFGLKQVKTFPCMTFLALWSVLPREQIWEDLVNCHMKIYCSVFKNIFNINKPGNNPGICVLYINKNIFWEGTLAELHIDNGNPYLTLGLLCYLSKSLTLFWNYN